MPDIGTSLREARMRARIDISEIESATKIRAKYLRALENEEWDLLPGPTYVKTFLRTYAEELGLDGKLLVEEYKLRHERLSDVELQPISPRSRARRQRPPRPGVPRWLVVAVIFIGLVAALYALGQSGEENGPPSTAATTGTSTTPQRGERRRTSSRARRRAAARRRRAAARRAVRLQLVPTAAVYVCLEASGGRVLVRNETLQPGQRTSTFRSRRFRMLLGNGQIRLRVNGRTRSLPASSDPVGYEITSTRRTPRPLPADQRPDCQ